MIFFKIIVCSGRFEIIMCGRIDAIGNLSLPNNVKSGEEGISYGNKLRDFRIGRIDVFPVFHVAIRRITSRQIVNGSPDLLKRRFQLVRESVLQLSVHVVKDTLHLVVNIFVHTCQIFRQIIRPTRDACPV